MQLSGRSVFAAALLGLSSPALGQDAPDAGARPTGAVEIEQPPLVPHPDLGFSLPPGFRATVFNQGVEEQRFFDVSSEGVLYVIKRDRGWFGPGIVALKDTDGDGVADLEERFGGFEGSNVEVHIDAEGQEWLYASSRTEVYRWALKPGDLTPSGRRERIVHGFLNNGREHPWKPMAFDNDGNLYVMVGAPSNACMEQRRTKGSPGQRPCPQLERQAGIWRFDAATPNQHQNDGERWATGVRNMLEIVWSEEHGGLFGASHGRDFLHRYFPEHFTPRDDAELPSEEFHLIREGDDLGWPYTYYDHEVGEVRTNPEYEPPDHPTPGRNRSEEGKQPFYGFPGHWAPFGSEILQGPSDFPDIWRRGVFVVFKGGWGRDPFPPQSGYRVVFVPAHEGQLAAEPVVFADDFEGVRPADYPADLPFPTSRYDGAHSPQGIAFGPDGAMYLGDQKQLKIWRITYEGDAVAEADLRALADRAARRVSLDPSPVGPYATGLTLASLAMDAPLGERLYALHCAACHQRDGRGVPGFAPSLHDSRLLAGRPVDLAFAVLYGLPESGTWANVMPAYADTLDDDELAALLNWSRARFTDGSAMSDADVASARERGAR
ncbi:MAG: c-type cytochrome [Oceanicaulis sp.]